MKLSIVIVFFSYCTHSKLVLPFQETDGSTVLSTGANASTRTRWPSKATSRTMRFLLSLSQVGRGNSIDSYERLS